jgi:membrane associated rhomboid family serine protease
MTTTGILGILIILINIGVSYKGLRNESFFEGYKFEVDKVLINRDYKRIITSGFLHVNWAHLIFNMLSLWFFALPLEHYIGEVKFLLIYFVSLIGGNLLSLFIHRHHGDYSSVGASGAIAGLIFACIALFPGYSIGLFFIPIPGWLYGLIYIAYSIYGIRSKQNNVGHESHLGGGLIGMLIAIAMYPSSLLDNYWAILIILIPAIAFMYIIIRQPHMLMVDNLFFKQHYKNYTLDDRYNVSQKNKEEELDKLLEKINKKGMNSLSKKEKDRLKELSR